MRVNRRFARMIGVPAEDLLGTLLSDWMAPGSRIYLDTHVFPLLYMQDGFQEVALDAKNVEGDTLPLLADGILVRDTDGEPARIRLTLVDARQRRRYEQELLEARREAEAAQTHVLSILEATPEPLVTIDQEGRILNDNAEARAFFGMTHEEMRGRPLDGLLGLGKDAVRTSDDTGRASSAFLETDVFARGERIPIEVRWKALGASDAERHVVSIRDLRPVRALEAERLEARARELELRRVRENDAFKSRFINAAAHSLRTPLVALRFQLDLLKKRRDPPPRDRYQRAIDMLDRQTGRLHHIAEQLIAVARIETQFDDEATCFPLGDIIDRTLAKMDDQAKAKAIVLDGAHSDLTLLGSPAVVERALLDLLDNALKFTAPGGHVEVTAEDLGTAARIAVVDDGIGIPPDQIHRVFETFGQVHDVHVTELGMGLSLYLSRQMIQRIGGEMGAESRGPGTGACFWFTVPKAPLSAIAYENGRTAAAADDHPS